MKEGYDNRVLKEVLIDMLFWGIVIVAILSPLLVLGLIS